MNEEWRDITGFEGFYQASSLGRIKSLDRYVRNHPLKGKVLIPAPNSRGYLRVVLCKSGVQSKMLVSRIVALTFILNPKKLPQVDHINEKYQDNRAVNLQWLSAQKNVERSLAKTYLFISPVGEIVEIFNLKKFCRRYRSLDKGSMYRVHLGQQGHHKGWKAA